MENGAMLVRHTTQWQRLARMNCSFVLRWVNLSALVVATIALSAAADSVGPAAGDKDRTAWERPPGWSETQGGARGKTYRVTTLTARGPGSLGEALAADGARIIEFAVGGAIDLGGKSFVVSRPYLTLAGETAPSPGITLVNGGMNINTHDVIIRHLRIR